MERRDFFLKGIQKITHTVVEAAEDRVEKRATHWIRPPYAVDELDFLITCTRCDDCIKACPYDVIFPLAARLGPSVAATPALDVLNKGCHLCEDWPCVNACQPEALKIPKIITASLTSDHGKQPEEIEVPAPKMAMARIDMQTCLPYQGPECGACAASCPVSGALSFNMTKPEIDPDLCTGCGLCREVCITSPKAIEIVSLQKPECAESKGAD